MAGLLLVLLLDVSLAQAVEVMTCPLRGMAYRAPDGKEIDAQIMVPANCAIMVERYERRIIMLAYGQRVEILIPDRLQGWSRFYYLWGSGTAYFGTLGVPVEWAVQDGLVPR